MATMMGGMGYGLYYVAKVFISLLRRSVSVPSFFFSQPDISLVSDILPL